VAAGLYRDGESFLHRAGTTAKIVSLIGWFTVALLLSRAASLSFIAVGLILVAAVSGLLGVLGRFVRFMVIMFVMSAVLWALFSRSEARVAEGALIGLRLTIMLTMGLVFLACTRVEDIAAGLHRLGLPFTAAFSLTLAFRLLPLFAASASTIAEAQACRGLDLREGGLIRRTRRYLPLLVPLVLSSLRSADRLAVALESRGLGMGPGRSSVIETRFGASELGLTALSILVAGAVITLRAVGFVI
jgi:energy-coupling factor transport system permease protein